VGDTFWNQFGHFVTVVTAYALALGMIALLICLLKKLGWRWPVEAVGFLERLLEGSDKDRETQKVNVEYRGADGRMLDFGLYVKAIIRNGHGRAVDLRQGAFCGCDPDVFAVGAACVVSVQDGIIKEDLIVQLDLVKKVLFVQSRFDQEQLLAALIGRLPMENVK
jgi:hypothetical protein